MTISGDIGSILNSISWYLKTGKCSSLMRINFTSKIEALHKQTEQFLYGKEQSELICTKLKL